MFFYRTRQGENSRGARARAAGEFFGEGCLAGQPLRMATLFEWKKCTLPG